MNHDYHDFVEKLVRQNKTLREFEIEKQIDAIVEKYQIMVNDEIAPLLQELAEIQAGKPPVPTRFGSVQC